ncbi:MAG: hypothetical protein ACRC62_29330 [Microcoleus sp.]
MHLQKKKTRSRDRTQHLQFSSSFQISSKKSLKISIAADNPQNFNTVLNKALYPYSTMSDLQQLPITNSQLPITNYQLPILNSQFPIPNSQLPIPNSQFPIPNSQFS